MLWLCLFSGEGCMLFRELRTHYLIQSHTGAIHFIGKICSDNLIIPRIHHDKNIFVEGFPIESSFAQKSSVCVCAIIKLDCATFRYIYTTCGTKRFTSSRPKDVVSQRPLPIETKKANSDRSERHEDSSSQFQSE